MDQQGKREQQLSSRRKVARGNFQTCIFVDHFILKGHEFSAHQKTTDLATTNGLISDVSWSC